MVEVRDNKYRFPNDREDGWQRWESAAHVLMPGWFWQAILGLAGGAEGLQRGSRGGVAYLTVPNEVFPWEKPSEPMAPPVPEKVTLKEVRGSMRLWNSQGRYGRQNLILITYEGRPDIYVKCDRLELDNSTRSCDLNWLDVRVIHNLSLPGNWLEKAPTIVELYAAAVKMR